MQGVSSAGYSSDTEASEAKRVYVCHHPNCFKAYKQPSGLRYHLKHVRLMLQSISAIPNVVLGSPCQYACAIACSSPCPRSSATYEGQKDAPKGLRGV